MKNAMKPLGIAKTLDALLSPMVEALRRRDIKCYEPHDPASPSIADPVIQHWRNQDKAYVVGVRTEPPGDITYDRKTGLTRSYTLSLHEENIGYLERLTQDHLTAEFIGDLKRFTTSPLYDAPTLSSQNVHVKTADGKQRSLSQLDRRHARRPSR